MPYWVCEQCGADFWRASCGPSRPSRFCTLKCYHVWNKANGGNSGQFRKGVIPWNKGVKGLRMSPATEFKKGQTSINKVPVGTIKVRRNKREKGPRAWIKIGEPSTWKLRAVYVWEQAYGPLPKGLLVHHEDCDTMNDDLTNLVAMSRAAHLSRHRPEHDEAKRSASMKKAWKKRKRKKS